MRTDLYAALGVGPDAEATEIRAAYLRLMRLHHPDHRSGDPQAQERARHLNAAFDVLGDTVKRAAYDRLRARRERTAAVTVVGPRAAAYSPERDSFQRSFSASILRMVAVLVATGAVLLLAVAPQ